MYSIFTVDNRDYKLRLNTRTCVALEKKFGCSPIEVLAEEGADGEGKMPKLENLILILQGSLQAYEHNFDLDATYDLYDKFVDGGGTLAEFIPAIMDIFKVSGFFRAEDIKKMEEAQAEGNLPAPKARKKKVVKA